MKKILNINEEERSRILNMHENATKKHYLSEAAPFGTKFVLDKDYQLLGSRGLPGPQFLKGLTWVFDGAKATVNTNNKTYTFRCDRPAGGTGKQGFKFMFTDGTQGYYTYDNSLENILNKQFCITTPKPNTDTTPPKDKKELPKINPNIPNEKVKELQKKLNTMSNVISATGSKLSEDGIFGSKTLQAALVALKGTSPQVDNTTTTGSIPPKVDNTTTTGSVSSQVDSTTTNTQSPPSEGKSSFYNPQG